MLTCASFVQQNFH